MSDLQSKIAALPEWPEEISRVGAYKRYKGHDYTVYDCGHSAETPYQTDRADAALARLALAREWIGDMHQWGCAALKEDSEGWSGLPCDCGRDALLAALGEPNE